MDRDELHSRIRRLLFASPALASAFARGDFRSVFRGRGIDFEALREYGEGDDARLIDWNVSVRFARPFVRTYAEDRSLTLFLLIDVSASMDAGSGELSKRDAAALTASLVAYAAQLRGMPVGALLFAGEPLRYFEPRRGKAHALAIIDAVVAARPADAARGGPDPRGGSDLGGAFESAARLLKRRSLVMTLSDFQAEGWDRPLALLARRHDAIALRVTDRLDLEPPARGAFFAADAEGSGGAWLPFSSRAYRARWAERGREAALDARERCLEARASFLEIDTGDDPVRRLLEFFDARRRP
ncbi:MAG: DUF58 domain-containing protein [Spirochaetaceae bacterium]|nr:DUF58 domain-containing protein [Spirochaetaceae bacterium]